MKKVFLKELQIINFKGIHSLNIGLSDETFIHGANGSGKTTIVDAFLWLLFGKNSSDKKDFSIKPLDHTNNTAEKTESQITGVFVIDNSEYKLVRILKEKWTKRRGSEEEEFTGNETLFFWNDVPCQAGEYQKKVSELIDEQLFKLITSPMAFNALDWKEKRRIITGVVGNVSDTDIASTRKEFTALLNEISGKSIEEYRKEIAAKKKGLKERLDQIPSRIDELRRSMPEAPDTDLIQIDINNAEMEIQKCNDLIKDQSKASHQFFAEKTQRNERIYQIRTSLSSMLDAEKNRIRSAYADGQEKRSTLEREIRSIEAEAKGITANIADLERQISAIDNSLAALRADWTRIDSSEINIDPSQFVCPTCKRAFDDEDIVAKEQELTANFNQKKASDLSSVSQRGKAQNDQKTALQQKIEELRSLQNMQKEIIDGKLTELKAIEPAPYDYEINIQAAKNLNANKEHEALGQELDRLTQLNDLPFAASADTDKIEAKRKQFEQSRDELKLKLKDQDIITRNQSRIHELEDEARTFSQQIATLEKTEFTIQNFEKAKMDFVEEKVNSLFTTLKVKMFKTQINGGIEPTCEILINGVPFSDANTASQINAGIEIINILCDSMKVSAPIFVDGRESVTNIIKSNSQIINLVVSPEHTVLTVK
jgi:exonuclease SbcC